MLQDALENDRAVGGSETRVAGTLWMRHQTEDVPALVTDARDVLGGPIRIGLIGDRSARIAIAEKDLPISVQLFERFLIGHVTAFAMGDRDSQAGAGPCGAGPWRLVVLDPHAHVLANEVEILIPDQCSGQQSRFAKNLE